MSDKKENHTPVKNSPLGEKSHYIAQYDNSLLFPIPRALKRQEIGVNDDSPPFTGVDIWNAYEVSWLNEKGKPQVAIAEFYISADTTCIIESKSFKLYLNSFNQTTFKSWEHVKELLMSDLSQAVDGSVSVLLKSLESYDDSTITGYQSECLDNLDIECDEYEINPALLDVIGNEEKTFSVYSNLLKSNCLVTGQPDWGSVEITYTGKEISQESLLRYIVSFRNHNEFHEQCVERIFTDIQQCNQPSLLTVAARYTRRGGLDINPIRSTETIKNIEALNRRQARQ